MHHTPKAPGPVVAAAVILFVYAAQMLFCVSCTGLMMAMDLDDGGVNELLAKEVPSFMAVQIGTLVYNVIVGGAMIATALGLLRLLPIARHAALGLAVVEIVVTLAWTVYNAILVVPVQNRVFAQEAQNMPPGLNFGEAMSLGTWGGLVFSVVLTLAVQLCVIYLLSGDKAKAAFSGDYFEPPPDAHRARFTGYDDDDDDDYGRPPPLPDAPPDTGFRDRS